MPKITSKYWPLLLLSFMLLSPLASAAETDGFLPVDEAFVFQKQDHSDRQYGLSWQIAPGYYLYRSRLSMQTKLDGNWQPLALDLPAGELKQDPNFGEVEVWHEAVAVDVVLPPNVTEWRVRYQGCAEAGLCYPPQKRTFTLEQAPANADVVKNNAEVFSEQLGESSWLTVASFFGVGLLLAFTPCVFPMVPILSGIVVGAGAVSRRKAFLLSASYVLAMALTYALAGVASGLLGGNLQAAFQQPLVLVAFALLFVALALSMYGYFELQLPASIQTRFANLSNKQSAGHYGGAAIMGALSALIVGPCVAPPLAGALIYISQTGDAWLGGLALFALSIGMGVPLLVIGTAAGDLLPRAGMWMERVKRFFGLCMLAMAIYMLERVLSPVVSALIWSLWAGLLAIFLWPSESPLKSDKLHIQFAAVLAIAVSLAAATIAVDAARQLSQEQFGLAGVTTEPSRQSTPSYSDIASLQSALALSSSPVLVDVYADWCTACKTMEKEVYHAPAFVAEVPLPLWKLDVTEGDTNTEQWLRQQGVVGPPALLKLDADGVVKKVLVGEQPLATVLSWVAAD